MTRKQLMAAMVREEKRLAQARDNLQKLSDEIEALYEEADIAHDALQECIDTLSQHR